MISMITVYENRFDNEFAPRFDVVIEHRGYFEANNYTEIGKGFAKHGVNFGDHFISPDGLIYCGTINLLLCDEEREVCNTLTPDNFNEILRGYNEAKNTALVV